MVSVGRQQPPAPDWPLQSSFHLRHRIVTLNHVTAFDMLSRLSLNPKSTRLVFELSGVDATS